MKNAHDHLFIYLLCPQSFKHGDTQLLYVCTYEGILEAYLKVSMMFVLI